MLSDCQGEKKTNPVWVHFQSSNGMEIQMKYFAICYIAESLENIIPKRAHLEINWSRAVWQLGPDTEKPPL